MMDRGQLVMTPAGKVGMVLTIFDAVVYQPTQVELLVDGDITVVPCNKLIRLDDSPRSKTLEELINSEYNLQQMVKEIG